jgi:hypothetical protein
MKMRIAERFLIIYRLHTGSLKAINPFSQGI